MGILKKPLSQITPKPFGFNQNQTVHAICAPGLNKSYFLNFQLQRVVSNGSLEQVVLSQRITMEGLEHI